ncbi:MAG: thiazole synthase [Opitutales bacterium]|nr:thiazole synthase [Opitutales bacterium]
MIGGREFSSRLFVGTGKFASNSVMKEALGSCGASMATVALKRANLANIHDESANILDFLEPSKYLVVPNTSGAMNAEEAVRIARLGQAAGLGNFVKLEIHPDPNYLLPDPIETLKATEILASEGFFVLAYMNADPALAARLQDAGVAAVMPLGAPIGTNRGIETRAQIEIIIEQARVPVVVDAGIGLPSHAAQAMEMGADAVLINTAVAIAKNPVEMAKAFALAVEAGRAAFLNGASGGGVSFKASPTSPLTGFLNR